MTGERDELIRRIDKLFGYALIAAGALITLLAGLCTVGVVGGGLLEAVSTREPALLANCVIGLIGLIPMWVGYMLVKEGLKAGKRP